MMQQCSKSRAYYSYDDNTMAISTLTVHENRNIINFSSLKVEAEKRIQTSK